MIHGLALCAGVGGLELGLRLALGDSYRTVGYVERDSYAAATLVARMEDEAMDQAPIADDLATFDGTAWRGCVDIVTAGFPCQPFSQAGKRLYEDDPRWLWPAIRRIVEDCAPGLVFLENVARSAFREPYRDLRAMGFSLCPLARVSAASVGAGHLRRRWFLLAYADSEQLREQPWWGCWEGREGTAVAGEIPGNPQGDAVGAGLCSSHPPGERRRRLGDPTWWGAEPDVARVVHGLPHRVDRARCLGNAVVPLVAATAFRALADRMT